MVIINHEWKQNRKLLFVWTVTVGVLILSMIALYPTFEGSLNDMADMFAQMGTLSLAFGLDKLSMNSPAGYYASQIGIILSIGGAMYASILGIDLIAKEEGSHTAEFLLTTPNSRLYFLCTKLMILILLIFTFNAVCYLFGLLGFACIKETISIRTFTLYHFAQFLTHLELGLLCFCISCFIKKPTIGLGLGLSLLLYFSSLFININEHLSSLKYVTPFYYSDAAHVFSTQTIETNYVIFGFIAAILSTILGMVTYIRKDIC